MTTTSILDLQDQASKYLKQTKAVVTGLVWEEQLSTLSTANLTDMLWLVLDRLEDIEATQRKLFEAIPYQPVTLEETV